MTVAAFVHIPKTGGLSVQAALDLQQFRNWRELVKGARYAGLVTFGHCLPDRLIRDGYVDAGDVLWFTFVRNPYDRAVSLWAHWKGEKPGRDLSFPAWCKLLDEWNFRQRTPQARWFEGVGIDYVGRFESLRADFDGLCDWLQVKRRTLPYLNVGDRGPCWAYYDDEAQDIIRRHYAADFERFDYADDCVPD